ncbi:MAG: hypothetical protein HC837_01190 [Chloroflexaceae bacterium]|nr:hypothetical protein [Chloroflexaceae bacterium]
MSVQRILLPASRSQLVQQNGGYLYGCCLAGMEGRFRKDQPIPLAYGRRLCDQVKQQFACEGFFTSDELPRYGISRADIRKIYRQMGKAPDDGTLIVLCAYDWELSSRICAFLMEQIHREHEVMIRKWR